jgi:hypothetical protein
MIENDVPPPVCVKSGFCLDFGENDLEIKNYFDYFVSFHYAKNISRIGKPSNNGFIYKLEYERNGYKANAILKSALENGDNLMYEYLVGCFINQYKKKFPCFVETYGLFEYENEINPNLKTISNKFLTDNLKLLDYAHQSEYIRPDDLQEYFKTSCKEPSKIAILIENVETSTSIEDFFLHHRKSLMRPPKKTDLHDCYYLLFQLYYVLSQMSDVFTHYDLHGKNVLVYELEPNKWIQMHYTLSDGTLIHFQTQYLIKIIDYGRCYFNGGSNNTSPDVFRKLCQTPHCNEGTGIEPEKCIIIQETNYPFGYPTTLESTYQITPLKRNKSFDLLILYFLKTKYPNNDFFEAVVYQPKPIPDTNRPNNFGTAEVEIGTFLQDGYIRNVDDALLALTDLIRTSKQIPFLENEKLGDLHIYPINDNRNMEFTHYSPTSSLSSKSPPTKRNKIK